MFEPNITRPSFGRPEYFITSRKMAREFFRYFDGRECKIFAVAPPKAKRIFTYEDAIEFFRASA